MTEAIEAAEVAIDRAIITIGDRVSNKIGLGISSLMNLLIKKKRKRNLMVMQWTFP